MDAGTLGTLQYLSLAEASLGSGFPCDSGLEAASSLSLLHSGFHQGALGGRVVTIDTATIASAHTFAVCYSEDGTDLSARKTAVLSNWVDSGIRLTRSKVESLV